MNLCIDLLQSKRFCTEQQTELKAAAVSLWILAHWDGTDGSENKVE